MAIVPAHPASRGMTMKTAIQDGGINSFDPFASPSHRCCALVPW
jgi:hypothetical protein